MAKFTVFYLRLSKEQTDQINAHGWNCDVGKAYMSARMGDPFNALQIGLYEPAAIYQVPGRQLDAEQVWVGLQNLDQPWTVLEEKGIVKRLTSFPRSCDVGDILYDHDDDLWAIVASFGFDSITEAPLIALLNPLLDATKG